MCVKSPGSATGEADPSSHANSPQEVRDVLQIRIRINRHIVGFAAHFRDGESLRPCMVADFFQPTRITTIKVPMIDNMNAICKLSKLEDGTPPRADQ